LAPEPPPRPTPPPPVPPPPAQQPWQEPEPARRHGLAGDPEWRPAPAEGQFIPAGNPGSNWLSEVAENGSAAQSVPAAPEPTPEPPAPEPAMTPPAEVPRGRHYTAGAADAEATRRARHSAPADADPGRRQPPPTLAPPPAPQPPPPAEPTEAERAARHRGQDEPEPDNGQHVGGQPVSELLARLQVGSTGGGRRRRRDE
jgi:hypothetical protein